MTIVNTVPLRMAMHDGWLDTAGAVVPSAPGLLITVVYDRDRQPVPGRFRLTHAASGHALADLAWCPHYARMWAGKAGWIGADWTRDAPALVDDDGIMTTLIWRMFDEFEPHCDGCQPVEYDDVSAAVVTRFRRSGVSIRYTGPPAGQPQERSVS